MTYDKLNRVISRVKTDLATNEKTEENYTYDAAGNITKYKSEETETNMSYGSNNELKGSDSCTFTYDLDGNMIETSIETIDKLHFNVDNKLTQAGKDEYKYDAEGSRVSQKDDNGTVRYTYDVQNSQLLMEYDKDGNMTKYVYGNGLISQENKDGYRNFHYDLRGRTTALTDENGNITSRYNYSTYGQVITENEETNFLYNGRDGVIKDSNGLLYMRARYYMPNMMRFTSTDKVHGTVMEPATLNRYAYVEGNPVTKVDPSGYSSQPGSVGSILRAVGYKNRVFTAEFVKGMGNSGFIFNMDRHPILGVQFTTAHRICDVGGLAPVIDFGFDIGNTIIYDLEGYKVKSAASIAGVGLNLFGTGLLAKGSMSSLDNFAEAGVKYSDDAIEAGVKSGIGYSKSGSNPIGATYEGTIYRSVDSRYDPLEMSQYTINSNHRYTESGVLGLYFSSGEKIVKAELGNYDVFDFSNRTMYSYDVRLTNMLDVSNPSVRSQLGISLESIVGESYDVTHAIGQYAYSNGYNGIIAPSARADGGINIILFNAKGVK